MATRDRFGGFGEPVANTPLQRYILNACDPQNFEPNLALNLEIADLINAKKGSTPREAAVAIVNYVNHRNANVSLLALNLLDICVKNCGYPFHLQISTKEFLNELVRRFPERPPMHASRVQQKILGLIEEWRTTICQTSRYKEDLGFIRDMHRLLSYKGYVFPAANKEDVAVLNPSDGLRSAEQMEEEEREAQSAKLQELIRRGGPADLQEANKLMKVMAGYDTRNKTDWRAKAAEEVAQVQQKAKLLEDMLQNQKQGDSLEGGDVFEELANALMSAHPKIQKMCEEESDDHEAVNKLLEINDSIYRTIERYKLIKGGDVTAASKIPKGTLGTSGAGVQKGPNNELSLIDFGGPEDEAMLAGSGSAAAAAQPSGNALADDLLGLSLDALIPATGDITLGGPNSFGAGPSNHSQLSNSDITSLFNQPKSQAAPSNAASFAPTSSSLLSSPPLAQQQLQPQPKSDPFAALNSSQASRTASPFQFQQAAPAVSALAAKPPQSSTNIPTQAQPSLVDDEWDFASALPSTGSATLTLVNSSINISWQLTREAGDTILIKQSISNNALTPVAGVTFQVAVTKSYTLELQPQSSLVLGPNQKDGITQSIKVKGVARGQGSKVRMRWKVSYSVGGQSQEDSGAVDGLPDNL